MLRLARSRVPSYGSGATGSCPPIDDEITHLGLTTQHELIIEHSWILRLTGEWANIYHCLATMLSGMVYTDGKPSEIPVTVTSVLLPCNRLHGGGYATQDVSKARCQSRNPKDGRPRGPMRGTRTMSKSKGSTSMRRCVGAQILINGAYSHEDSARW